jgi:dTDP-4-dehydrorhamnose reductase
MRILLTGANGYIGTRLLPVLLEQGHDVVCIVCLWLMGPVIPVCDVSLPPCIV